ncbi:PQQ-dependent sugar dehydrogenase [Pseudooceanicola aestuarii]|uniref:PQQ-dependent sugar dehydrogenase n=1 Tax=Pseudooceanicola aestuarii TaxID=2697319 RepID=UPI0013D57053|nr:PQQ-dependent sugar dehydrogenase [Pseudooceanicola aestuarii]
MPRRPLVTAAALSLLGTLPLAAQDFTRQPRNTDLPPAFPAQFRAPLEVSDIALRTETIADGLVHPWGMEVLPDGAGYLVTERAGRMRHIAPDGSQSDPISGLPQVAARDQGGLLDVALAPDFVQSREIWWSYAKRTSDGYVTAAARGILAEDFSALTQVEEVFVQTPAADVAKHFGSRIVFDTAGHVFITTGEHSARKWRGLAQEKGATFGKVIRLSRDGTAPEDNPFFNEPGAIDTIWSYGHRNIQGATMIDGALWTIEHGPRGGDELNRPEAGKNYGWPVITHGQNYDGSPVGAGLSEKEGMEQPVYFWDPVIAPAGMMVYEGEQFGEWTGDLLISSLNPGGIVRLELSEGRVTAEERLLMDLGRVRDLAVDADGSILALTDQQNGRLVRIAPQQ